jgi:hypothetical protein
MNRGPGQVIGTAGGSLQNSGSWASSKGAAKAGSKGETLTAEVLHQIANAFDGPTVFHDLRIPIPGISANIDHLVVSGKRVLIIDSKLWKPGFYWTIAGRSFRGLERFPSADKKTMVMARESIVKLLDRAGVRARVARPVVLIWPSNQAGAVTPWLLRIPGATAKAARQYVRILSVTERGNADPKIVAALLPLVIGSKNSRSATPATQDFAPDEL